MVTCADPDDAPAPAEEGAPVIEDGSDEDVTGEDADADDSEARDGIAELRNVKFDARAQKVVKEFGARDDDAGSVVSLADSIASSMADPHILVGKVLERCSLRGMPEELTQETVLDFAVRLSMNRENFISYLTEDFDIPLTEAGIVASKIMKIARLAPQTSATEKRRSPDGRLYNQHDFDHWYCGLDSLS
jgi:hypothetical protein